MSMQWASAVSIEPRLADAIAEAVGQLEQQLTATTPTLVVAFVSPHHQADYARLPELIAARLGDAFLVGCSAGGVIGGGREVERTVRGLVLFSGVQCFAVVAKASAAFWRFGRTVAERILARLSGEADYVRLAAGPFHFVQ